jgi:hypothetical protein
MRLDVSGTTPQLSPADTSGSDTGQQWSVTDWGDNSYGLASGGTGKDLFMDTYSNTLGLVMDGGGHSGQHWKLEALGLINNSSFTV